MTHPDASLGLPKTNIDPIAITTRAGFAKHAAKRPPIWFSILGSCLALLLLVTFQRVVQGAVNQGAERHKSTALLAKATRQCKALRDAGASERCSQQLDSSPIGAEVKTVFLTSF